ncbi:hypothetical protein [Caminibacter pacificus]
MNKIYIKISDIINESKKDEKLKIIYEIYEDENEKWYVIYYPFNAKCKKLDNDDEKNLIRCLKNKLSQKISSIKSRYKKDKFIIFKYYLKNKKIVLKSEEMWKKFIKLKHKYDFETIKLNGREYSVKEIWQDLDKYNLSSKDNEEIDKEIDKEKIKELLINPVCEYCGITQDEVNELFNKNKIYTKRNRGYSMEIDKKEPFKGYTKDNIVSCCYWCNNAKSDEFSYKEFKEIAKSIRKIWEKRLK